MKVIYAQEPFPPTTQKSLFLAGPTPRSYSVPSWRPDALAELERLGYDGDVYVPESRDGHWSRDGYEAQLQWEAEALNRADQVVFWVPRDMTAMPGLTTNVEWGMLWNSGRVVLGYPLSCPDAGKNRYLEEYAKTASVPVEYSLSKTLAVAVKRIGAGAPRAGGQCCVPLALWRHKAFQAWLKSQEAAGNHLHQCTLHDTFWVGPKRDFLFSFRAHVSVWVAAEGRYKSNEHIIGRTDLSSVVLVRRDDVPLRSKVVLVREFRSPARTRDGFIRELPGGSCKDTEAATQLVAQSEVEEEVGFKLDVSRIIPLGTRQVAGTLSVHTATLFGYHLSDEEFAEVQAGLGQQRGVAADTEQTYSEVYTVEQLLQNDLVDWSTLGMILSFVVAP